MLSGLEIINQVHAGTIKIDPWCPENVGPNSIDLRLGNRLLLCLPNGQGLIDTRKPGVGEEITLRDGAFYLYPGRVYIGHTLESVQSDAFIPMLHGRSSLARHGVAVHVEAGFGDVGWGGQWVLELVNHNAGPVLIYPGDRIAQCAFEPVTGEIKPYASAYMWQTGPRLSKGVL